MVWLPLINIDKSIGPLEVCDKSSLDGFIKVKRKVFKKKNYSPQFKINDKIARNYKVTKLYTNISDVLFLNKNTIHRSGKNNSKKFRFSLLIRFHDLSDSDYLSHKTKIILQK